MDFILEVEQIHKSYGPTPVVAALSLALERGRIGCLLGPSGCGKTTVLRSIAGFETIDKGQIRINGEVVSAPNRMVPPERRKLGMVFQDYALFPHLTVAENIGFGIPGNGRQKRCRIEALMELVGLSEARRRRPHQLSGGQQQRMALARALAPEPDLLLLDEPFSNLDVALREHLSLEVRNILKSAGTSALLVTHHQGEAFAMADEIGVVHAGRLAQWDTAYNLYHRPATPFVAAFVGEGTLIPGRVVDERHVETGLGLLEGQFTHPCPGGCPVDVLIRPEDVLHEENADLQGRIEQATFRGPNILYTLALRSGDRVQALVPSHCQHQKGDWIGIRPTVRHIIPFERRQPHAGQACSAPRHVLPQTAEACRPGL